MTAARIDVGLTLPMAAPATQVLDVAAIGPTAEWAEQQGFDTLWAPDHIYHPVQIMDCLTTLAFVAARTKTIRLGSGVLLLPMRQLGVVAKQISALSLLSEGRFTLGVGVGGEWPAEWTAAGVPHNERGARLDEMLPVLRRLLAGETVDFQGRFTTLPGVSLMPAPPPVPFYFAGRARPALERAALQGDGWLGYLLTVNGFKRDREAILEIRESAGLDGAYAFGMQLTFRFDTNNDGAGLRAAVMQTSIFPGDMALTPPDKLERFIAAGTPDRVLEMVQGYIDAGCRTFSFVPVGGQPDAKEQMQILASEILPKLKKA